MPSNLYFEVASELGQQFASSSKKQEELIITKKGRDEIYIYDEFDFNECAFIIC